MSAYLDTLRRLHAIVDGPGRAAHPRPALRQLQAELAGLIRLASSCQGLSHAALLLDREAQVIRTSCVGPDGTWGMQAHARADHDELVNAAADVIGAGVALHQIATVSPAIRTDATGRETRCVCCQALIDTARGALGQGPWREGH